MQLGVGKTVFPGWAAAATLVKDHGTDAAGFATKAVKASDGAARLDAAVRAMTSFDHAVDNAQKLPVKLLVPGSRTYFAGYDIAKQAVTLLVASGVVAGARERVGRGTLTAAKDAFLAGIEVSQADRSRFGRKLATGWLEAAGEDAAAGALMLRPGGTTSRELLLGVEQVRRVVSKGQALDAGLVSTVSLLFDVAGAELDTLIEQAQGATRTAASTADTERVMAESRALLERVALDAAGLAAAAPDAAAFQRMRAS